MEKLIDECGTPNACWNCQPEPCDQCDTIDNIFQRLKEYEDTDRMPDEILGLIAEVKWLTDQHQCDTHNLVAMNKTLDQQAKNCEKLLSNDKQQITMLKKALINAINNHCPCKNDATKCEYLELDCFDCFIQQAQKQEENHE